MIACTFFGHRTCPDTIKPGLRDVLIELITNYGVNMFYVGNQGRFDAIVRGVLRELNKEFSEINYAVVLAYLPGKQNKYDDFSDTMLPEGVESVHPRYAVSWRNNWMIRNSDYVVTYITHSGGGAAKYAEVARRQRKVIISLATPDNIKAME